MKLARNWQSIFLFLVLFLATGMAACTGVTGEPAALPDLQPPAQSTTPEVIQANGRSEATLESEAGEFTGTLEMAEGDLWTIDGETYAITSQMETKDDIAPGDRINVHTLTQPDGTIVLREVELANAADTDDDAGDDMNDDGDNDDDVQEREFTGTVELIDGDLWTIDGETYLLNGQTEIKGDFAPGDVIKVHLLIQTDGTFVLREVELADTGGNDKNDDADDDMDDDTDHMDEDMDDDHDDDADDGDHDDDMDDDDTDHMDDNADSDADDDHDDDADDDHDDDADDDHDDDADDDDHDDDDADNDHDDDESHDD